MYNNTKVTLYAIWKDTTPPTVALQPNGGSYIIPSTGTLNIQTKITVSDNESGFSTLQYAWSTNQKVKPTTGWTNFSSGQTVTLPEYTDTNYYLWIDVVDKAGNVANNIRVSNAFSVYSIQLKSGLNKTEYENNRRIKPRGVWKERCGIVDNPAGRQTNRLFRSCRKNNVRQQKSRKERRRYNEEA